MKKETQGNKVTTIIDNKNDNLLIPKRKEIQLDDSEFEKLINLTQQIESYNQEIKKLENHRNDIIALICKYNNVETKDIKINIDAENKKLIIT